jgi:hypothetical protein
MGGKIDLVITIVLLGVGFALAPLAVNSIPVLAGLGKGAKIALCFILPILVFFMIILTWGALCRKKDE